MGRRPPAKKCPRGCTYFTEFGMQEEPLAMRRLYVKHGTPSRFIAVGWVCLSCGYVEVDKDLLKRLKWDLRSGG